MKITGLAEHLSSKREALSSNPSAAKNKKKSELNENYFKLKKT
jgi:hypothetical protein